MIDEPPFTYPNVPRWFLDDRTDLSTRLQELRMPVLLLWGGSDPIRPFRVGQLLSNAHLALS